MDGVLGYDHLDERMNHDELQEHRQTRGLDEPLLDRLGTVNDQMASMLAEVEMLTIAECDCHQEEWRCRPQDGRQTVHLVLEEEMHDDAHDEEATPVGLDLDGACREKLRGELRLVNGPHDRLMEPGEGISMA